MKKIGLAEPWRGRVMSELFEINYKVTTGRPCGTPMELKAKVCYHLFLCRLENETPHPTASHLITSFQIIQFGAMLIKSHGAMVI